MSTTITLTLATGTVRDFSTRGEMYAAVCACHNATTRDIDTRRKNARGSLLFVRGALVGEFTSASTPKETL